MSSISVKFITLWRKERGTACGAADAAMHLLNVNISSTMRTDFLSVRYTTGNHICVHCILIIVTIILIILNLRVVTNMMNKQYLYTL